MLGTKTPHNLMTGFQDHREIKAYTRDKSLGLNRIHQMCNGENTSDLEREKKSTQDAVITS